MLGRTANDLFWLSRYVERAENLARLLEVGFRIVLVPRGGNKPSAPADDGVSGALQHDWLSTLQSAGCTEAFGETGAAVSTRSVIDFLLFDLTNPSSVRSCLTTARRNARAQRTSLTREMWESLNSSWIEFEAIKPDELSSSDLLKLLDWVKERSALYRGALMNTILRNDTFYFSQLGTFLERADNTARILDVKYFVLLPKPEMIGSEVDNSQWNVILRSVSAHRSYRWVYKDTLRAAAIADFLILNRQMPRSLHACVAEYASALSGLEAYHGSRNGCSSEAEALLADLNATTIDAVIQSGLHEFVTAFIARNTALSQRVADTYYFTQ
jgi:uncharacterized alpha-E superfamily protein